MIAIIHRVALESSGLRCACMRHRVFLETERILRLYFILISTGANTTCSHCRSSTRRHSMPLSSSADHVVIGVLLDADGTTGRPHRYSIVRRHHYRLSIQICCQ